MLVSGVVQETETGHQQHLQAVRARGVHWQGIRGGIANGLVGTPTLIIGISTSFLLPHSIQGRFKSKIQLQVETDMYRKGSTSRDGGVIEKNLL